MLHVHDAVARTPGVARVLVATEDERVARVVRAAGAHCVLTSERHRTGTDRCAEVAAMHAPEHDVIVNVQGDQLGLGPAFVSALGRALDDDPDAAMATLATVERGAGPDTREAFASRHVVKVVTDAAGRALYFSRAPIPYGRDVWLRHVGIYAYRRDALLELASSEPTPLERAEDLEQLRALELGLAIRVGLVAQRPRAVDVPEDLERERRLAAAAHPTAPEV